jgi:hypothetical protein
MSTSTKSKSGELLDRYLHAVSFWLPKKQQADIIAELSEDLRSQVEDKEAELRRPLDDDETMAILKRCGSPILVASRYRPQTSLIGPVLFPIYEFVLKLVLLWVLVPVFILIVGPALILSAADHAGAFFTTIRTLWTTLFMTAAVITLVFAALERTGTKLHLEDRWDKRSLPQLPKQPQLPSTTHTIFELVFALLGIVWLLAVPHYPFLLFGPAAAFLQPAPLWNTFYGPLVVLAFLSLARHGIQVARPQWTWFPPTAQLFSTVVGLMVVKYLIDAASKPLNGEWHPFVVLGSSIQPTVQLARVVGFVNASVLLAMAATWLGLSIAAVIQAGQLVRHLRKRKQGVPSVDPALMRLL